MKLIALPGGELVADVTVHHIAAAHAAVAEKARADAATAALQLLLAALVGLGDPDAAIYAAMHHLIDPYGERVHEAARAAGLAAKAREDAAKRRLAVTS